MSAIPGGCLCVCRPYSHGRQPIMPLRKGVSGPIYGPWDEMPGEFRGGAGAP
jgi:hypothetical protein